MNAESVDESQTEMIPEGTIPSDKVNAESVDESQTEMIPEGIIPSEKVNAQSVDESQTEMIPEEIIPSEKVNAKSEGESQTEVDFLPMEDTENHVKEDIEKAISVLYQDIMGSNTETHESETEIQSPTIVGVYQNSFTGPLDVADMIPKRVQFSNCE